MSELIDTKDRRNFRWQFLASVSAATLIGLIFPRDGKAADSGKPSVWIELGGQLERINGGLEPYTPAFAVETPLPAPYSPISPIQSQRAPSYSFGAEGRLVFTPDDSDWVYSASIRYGRSNGKKHIHQQSMKSFIINDPEHILNPAAYPNPTRELQVPRFMDSKVRHDESHFVLDFLAGKDVGLGSFGRGGSSVFSLGLRYAEFVSKRHVGLVARPDPGIYEVPVGPFVFYASQHNDYLARSDDRSSFHGLGPSLSWDASAIITGQDDEAVSINWGVNAGLLFGRQKANGDHQETQNYYRQKYTQGAPPYGVQRIYYHHLPAHARNRSVVVPNLGGFAGLSYRYENARLSFGYRSDFFFGAIDTGIDTRKAKDVGFHGPFATVSIRLGG